MNLALNVVKTVVSPPEGKQQCDDPDNLTDVTDAHLFDDAHIHL